jgi:hypothetical protein
MQLLKKIMHKKLILTLLIPFVIAIGITQGLNKPFPTYHGNDEALWHYPVIISFSEQMSHGLPDLSSYDSATTPLFHLINALIVYLFNPDLSLLRLINVLISICTVMLFYSTLHRQLDYSAEESFFYGLVFGLSPYFFGTSFILHTDNLGFLFLVAYLNRLMAYRKNGLTMDFHLSLLALVGAIYTRQLYVWLFPSILYCLLISAQSPRVKLFFLIEILLAILPLFFLLLIWSGLTPPRFQEGHEPSSTLNHNAPVLFFAVIAVYATLLHPGTLLRYLAETPFIAMLVVSITIVYFSLFPIFYDELGGDGYLWRLSSMLPDISGSNLVFWLFTPVGLFVLLRCTFESDRALFSSLLVIPFLLVSIFNMSSHQKYYDPYAFVLLLVIIDGKAKSTKVEKIGVLTCLILFLAYDFRYQLVEFLVLTN